MKYDIQSRMYRLSVIMEVIVGVIVTIAIGFSIVGIAWETNYENLFMPANLLTYLETVMGIIIGIEFIKLIFSHTMDAAVEVMLLAIVRQMIIDHASASDNLQAVIAVALLFVVRKYLFVRKLDHMPSHTHSIINALLHPDRDAKEQMDEEQKDRMEHLTQKENELLAALQKLHEEQVELANTMIKPVAVESNSRE